MAPESNIQIAGVALLPISIFPPLRWWLWWLSGKAEVVTQEPFLKQSMRNRYALVNEGQTIWLSIPVSAFNRFAHTENIQVSYDQNWTIKHLQSMRTCYGKTPYFDHYIEPITSLFAEREGSLLHLFYKSRDMQYSWLGKPIVPAVRKSEIKFDFAQDRDYTFGIKSPLPPYYQVFMDKGLPFVDHLSLLDLIFNEGPMAALYLNALLQKFSTEELKK
jgi:hypothetical protein